MIHRSLPSVVALAAFWAGAGLCAAESSGATKPSPASPPKAAAASPAAGVKNTTPAADVQTGASATATKPATPAAAPDVQSLVDKFKADREKILEKRDALEKALKAANESEKKKIVEQIEKDQKDLLEAQRALGKKIRDDMRKLRPSPPPPGRR